MEEIGEERELTQKEQNEYDSLSKKRLYTLEELRNYYEDLIKRIKRVSCSLEENDIRNNSTQKDLGTTLREGILSGIR